MNNYFKNRATQFSLNPKNIKKIALSPKNALIELSNGCNHACIFCKNSHQGRRTSHLDFNIYAKFVSEACDLGLNEIGLYSTGEPFMTKSLEQYISFAKKAGIRRVYITTNGALANLDKVKKCFEVGLDSIKFSINAGNEKDYLLVHGVNDFNKVKKNVEDIYNWKVISNIQLQLLGSCVLIPSLTHTKTQHYNIFSKYFEDITYNYSSSQAGQIFDIPIKKEELRNIFFSKPEISDDDKIEPCDMLWNRYHLTAEGYLTTCCVDYDLNLVFGDIKSEPLKKIWNNEDIKSLRQKHLDSDLSGTLCNQCLRNKKCNYKPLLDVTKKKLNSEQFDKKQSELITRIDSLNKS